MRLAVCAAVLIAGTASPALARLPGAVPPSGNAEAFMTKLGEEGEQNRVLNQMEIGARLFWDGRLDEAAAALDDAVIGIETVFANDPNATKARSLWYEEGSKSFKGEPYERAMVYYYRGLIYLRKGDYENARAAFRNGLMQDAFAEEEQNQADFAMLLFLDAWASHLNGDKDLRDEVLARLHTLRPDFPGIKDGDDTLVLIETGSAPRKLGDGLNHSYFVYRRGKGFKENRAELVLADQPTPAYPMEDIFYQAATRGGREIDKILDGKVAFKQTTGTVGSVLADSSVALTHLSSAGVLDGMGEVAAGLGAVSAITYLIANNAKPRADTRTWTSLPDTVHVVTLPGATLQSGGVAVRFLRDGQPVAEDKALNLELDPNGGGIALLRSR